ncbi:MAG: RuBisCO large subunit C-terminal-like domain-containing protein, partial [Fidelibacterota bacterium]
MNNVRDEEYIVATYYLETYMDLERAAAALAAEESTGTWVAVGKETGDVKKRFGAVVLKVNKEYENYSPSLPTRMAPRSGDKVTYSGGKVKIAFPHQNFGSRIPNLLSTVAGNLYEMGAFTAIKLLDLQFPSGYLREFQGPKFGIRGTRDILEVYDRPLLGAIIKPNVGLNTEELAELAYEGAVGGLDFLKDDELMGDPSHCPLKERVKKITGALEKAEKQTGKKTMYAFNITDRVDRVLEFHDYVVDHGGNCVMLNYVTSGIGLMRVLSEHTQVPIHAHRDFFSAFTRSPYLGMSSKVFSKISRMAWADQLHI